MGEKEREKTAVCSEKLPLLKTYKRDDGDMNGTSNRIQGEWSDGTVEL